MTRRAWLVVLLTALSGGCVERRYVVTSDPPGALVFRNGQPIGTTPVDDSFVYNGVYHFTLVKEGYETLQVDEDFKAQWFEYPPLDLLAENFWPFKIRDVRRPSYQLQPMQAVRHDDVLNRATELRARGKELQPFNPASVPPRRGGTAPAPVVTPAPAPAPGAVPAPGLPAPTPTAGDTRPTVVPTTAVAAPEGK